MTEEKEETLESEENKKRISRRQFLTGSTEGAVSFGVFNHPVAQVVATFASDLNSARRKEEQNKNMLERAKRKPTDNKPAV